MYTRGLSNAIIIIIIICAGTLRIPHYHNDEGGDHLKDSILYKVWHV